MKNNPISPFFKIYLSLLGFFLILAIGTVGYMLVEDYRFLDALYMTVITLATVGYMEVQPLHDSGRIFTIVLILANIGTFTYFITQLSTYIFDGEFLKTYKILKMKENIDKLEGHVIICGFGRTGKEAAKVFVNSGRPFVVIEKDTAQVEIAPFHVDYVFSDDATRDEVLLQAGIGKAAALIAALPEDADNLFVVLTARELNKEIKIISRAAYDTSVKKLKTAGANNVIMPDKIGGAHMATLVMNPDIKEFIDKMSTHESDKFRVAEIESLKTIPLSDLNCWNEIGATILGIKTPDGDYLMNPQPKTILYNGSKIIVMGSSEQVKRLSQRLS